MAIATVGSLVVVQSSATSVSTSITVPSGATHALVWGGGGNDGELPASISIGGQAGTFLIAQSLTAGGAYWLALVPISGSGSQTLAVADWNVGQGVSYMVRFLTATETVSVRDTADAFDEDITSLNPGSLDATAGDYVFAGSGTFPGGITFTWTNATELDEDGFNDISASVAEDDSASGAVTITATFSSEAEAAWIAAVALTDEEAADEITFGSGADNATLTWETIAPEDGDLILLAIANDGGDDQTAPTDWTAVTANGATADVEGMIYKWKADGTESGTIIANEGSFGVTGEEYCFHWWKIPASLWSGDLDEVEVSAVQEATSGTINPNNLTVAGWDGTAEDWLAFVFAVRDDDDGISSLGANYTATFQYTQSASSTGSCEIASAWRTISGSDSENPGAATQTNTNEGLRSWTVGVRGPVDAEPELAVEEATEADVASDVSLIVEPRLTVEQGVEEDVASDIALTVDPLFIAEAAAEDDLAFDVVLATETEFAAELATEENVAFDVEFAVDTGMAAEQATEEDVAQDVLLQTEPALDIEPASEDDQANDVVLAAEQAFTVEAAAEEDTAQDVVMAAEPVFIVEAASEDDVAEDVALLAEPVFVVEQAAEEDEAEDVQIGAASEFTTDEAVEIDQAFDVVIAAEPVFIVEPAVEDDTAEDIALSTDRAFIVEPASEDDVAEDVVLEAVATVFTVEPAAEGDQAFDVIIAVEPVFLVELATEIDLAREIDLDVGQPVKLGDVFCEMLAPTCGQTLLAPSVSAIVVDIDMVASTHGPRVATAIIGPSVTSEVE